MRIAYKRSDDHRQMIEIAPHCYLNLRAARRLGYAPKPKRRSVR